MTPFPRDQAPIGRGVRQPSARRPVFTTGRPPLRHPVAPAPRAARGGADASRAQRAVWGIGEAWRSVTAGVEWSLVYVSFVIYLCGIVSSRLRLGTAAMLAVAVGLLVQRRQPRIGWITGALVAFLAWTVIGYATTSYPDAVSEQVIELAKIAAVVLGGVNALRTRAQIRFCFVAVLFAFALYPGRGAYLNRLSGWSGRIAWNGIYANPNDMAAITLIILGIAATLVAAEPPGLVRTVTRNVGIPMLALLIAFTQSRGALIALAVMGLLALWHAPGRQRFRALLGAVGVGFVLALFAPSSMWERLRGLRNVTDTAALDKVDPEGSAAQRYEIWRVATTIIAENPVFGVGLGAYPKAHAVVAMRPEFKPIARGERDTHSTYLNLFAETGVVGLAIYACLVAGVFRIAERARRAARIVEPQFALQIVWLERTLLAFGVCAIWGSFIKIHMTYVALLFLYTLSQTRRPLAGVARGLPARRVRAG